MTRFMGIDIGSTATKGVIIEGERILASRVIPSGVNYRTAAQTLRRELLDELKWEPEDIDRVGATGHGARIIPFSDLEVLDVDCCARGARYYFPDVRTIIDVQDLASQVIRLSENGKVIDVAQGEACVCSSTA